MTDYEQFILGKHSVRPDSGFSLDSDQITPHAKPFQSDSIRYALRRGVCAFFWECGLGKTLAQLEWSYHVARQTEGLVLILCPLAVTGQTLREAEKFDIGRGGSLPIMVAKNQNEIPFLTGIVITNYDSLSKFDPALFDGIALDESSILKNHTGKKRNQLCEAFRQTPYKLCCTATPSPNDQTELGNHTEFLGVMRHSEMLGKYFVNESGDNKSYRLRKHAVKSFWEWVATWAVSLETPADLGYPADEYTLPELRIHEHCVDVDEPSKKGSEQLFSNESISATTLHRERRISCKDRAEKVASLVNDSPHQWVVWTDTDYEADEIARLIPDAVEVRGSFTDFKNEMALEKFALGAARVIIGKPKALGFGLNWQHTHHCAFVGISYSFEMFYQAVRRQWRFGQQHPVECHVVNSQSEQVVWRAVKKKDAAHRGMKRSLKEFLSENQIALVRNAPRTGLVSYAPTKPMIVPAWASQ